MDAQPRAGAAAGGARRKARPAGVTYTDQRYKFSHPYQFWYAYKRRFRKTDVRTQKELTAAARAHGIDQTDRSAENLDRMRAILAGK